MTHAIVFRLETLQPLLATSFQGDPNSDVSYPYIPGSMIRGALIGHYLSRHNVDLVTDDQARRLFFDGTTRYLNAYPCSVEGKRTLPLLLSWRKEKGEELNDDGLEVYDFSIEKPNRDTLKTPKSIGEGFWVEEDEAARLYNVARRINIHHVRDRRKGRATATEGEIFRYDAIDTGLSFQGVILYEEEEDANTLQQLITLHQRKPDSGNGTDQRQFDIWMGGSRSAGYGHIKITHVDLQKDWQEIEEPASDRAEREYLKITLLSDLIFRDGSGQEIAAQPGDLIPELAGSELKFAYMEATFIGGFNRKWGLPLPQVPAVKAGSVFVYEYESDFLTEDWIRNLEREGIGERKTEGFGRIAINWREEKEFNIEKPDSARSIKPEPPTSIDLATMMAQRILRQKLDAWLLNQVDRNKLQPLYLRNSQLNLRNSQLSRLVLAARQSIDNGSPDSIRELLKNLTKNTRSQYEKTKVNGKQLCETLSQWIDAPRTCLQGFIQEITIAGQSARLTDELALEYTLRLIMAIAKNAIRENKNDR